MSTKHSEAAVSTEPARVGQVLVVKHKRSKKRRYSKSLKRLGNAERWVGKAAYRMADALASGLQEYRTKSDKSARKKKDGALRDLFRNAIKGMSKTMSKASKVPSDLVNLMNRR